MKSSSQLHVYSDPKLVQLINPAERIESENSKSFKSLKFLSTKSKNMHSVKSEHERPHMFKNIKSLSYGRYEIVLEEISRGLEEENVIPRVTLPLAKSEDSTMKADVLSKEHIPNFDIFNGERSKDLNTQGLNKLHVMANSIAAEI